jgi:hypothetical protein
MSDHTEEHNTFNEEARRETSLLVAISRAIEASPVKHQGTREEAVRAIKARLEASHILRLSDRGWVTSIDRSGNPADFAKLVTDAMLLDTNIGDAASIAAAVAAGTISLGAKNEMTTVQQKCQFIKTYGQAAWEKLPAHRAGATVAPSKEMTKAQYLVLPLKDRMAFMNTITERELGAIMSRK